MDKSTIEQIIIEQKEIFEKHKEIVERSIPDNVLKTNKIVIITGIRRCGKSTLLKQISKNIENHGYFNFEDERLLDFTYKDFNNLLEIFLEINPDIKTFLFDEIQNIVGWEKFARRLFNEGYKIIITGSNAKLLSSEIATSLTGRNIKIELYPFNFKEYLTYNRFPLKEVYTTKEKAKLNIHLKKYLETGGFPEVVISEDKEELNQIYQDIIINDLLVRFGIRDTKDFRELSLYLLSNVTNKISFNNLRKLLGFSNTSKVKNYIDFLSEAYLFFTLFKYDPSIKKQIVNDRKIYAIDTGMINSIAFRFSNDKGKILENTVFLELLRQKNNIYYHHDKKECDFLIKEEAEIKKAIQVSANLASPDTRSREIAGLIEAIEKYNLAEGYIITNSEEGQLKIEGKTVKIVPLCRFLLIGLKSQNSSN